MQTLTVGVLADAGLPEKVARALSDELPQDLVDQAEVGSQVRWEVEVSQKTLPLTAECDIPLMDRAGELCERYGWDYVVFLTDLPRSHDGDPMLCEASAAAAAALVSLPALDAGRLARRACKLLTALVLSVREGTEDYPSTAVCRSTPASPHVTVGPWTFPRSAITSASGSVSTAAVRPRRRALLTTSRR